MIARKWAMRWQMLVLVAGIASCVQQEKPQTAVPSISSESENKKPDPPKLPRNPGHSEWPSLIGKRAEFIGTISEDFSKGMTGTKLLFDGTYLPLSEDLRKHFYEESFGTTSIKVVGILARVHSGVPLYGQQGGNGRVWETYVLEVERWNVVKPTEDHQGK